MARVPSATGPAPKDGWFKIYEDGFDPKADVWGVDKLIKNKGSVTVTIPACLPVGDYLLRGELIALHGVRLLPPLPPSPPSPTPSRLINTGLIYIWGMN